MLTRSRRGFRPFHLWILAAAITLVPWLPGCDRVEADDRTVEIRFTFWGKAQEARIWEKLADRFHQKQDGVRVKLEHITGWNYHAKVLAMTLGRCAPDVLSADDEQFRQLASSGLYENLSPYVERDLKAEARDTYPVFWNSFRIEDRQYSIPFIGNCLLVFYNRDLRRAAGLSPDPNPDWDWDEFNRDDKALTRDLNGDGRTDQFGLNRLSWFYCLQWVWSAGGTDMDADMSRYTFDTPEATRGLKFHYDQMHKLKVCPGQSDLPNMNWEAQFLTQKVASIVTGSWWLLQARQARNIDWDVAPMPIGPVKRATRATAEGLSISPQSKHKAESWQWIKFLLSDEAQSILGKSGRGIPARRTMALKSFAFPETPQHEEYFLQAMDRYSHRSSLHSKWMATEQQVFNPEWDRVYAGQITIEEWVKNTQPRAHKMMREDYP